VSSTNPEFAPDVHAAIARVRADVAKLHGELTGYGLARTVHFAREAGPLVPISQDAIDRLYDRYQNVYGQNGDARR
jgi:hypothetical protein